MPQDFGGPRVVVDGEGRGLAVWRRAPATAGDRAGGIYASRFEPGRGFAAPVLLSGGEPYGAASLGAPTLVMDDEGRAFAFWEQRVDAASQRSEVACFEPTSGWSSATAFLADGSDPVSSLGIVMAGSGTALAAFQRARPADGQGTWVSRFEPDVGFGAASLVIPGSRASPALGEADHAALTWSEAGAQGSYAFWIRRSDPSGVWGPAETLGSGLPEDFSSVWLGGTAIDVVGDTIVVDCSSDAYGARCGSRLATPTEGWTSVPEFGVGAIRESRPTMVVVASGESFLALVQNTSWYTPVARRYRVGPGVDFRSAFTTPTFQNGSFATTLVGDRAGGALAAWRYLPENSTAGPSQLVTTRFDPGRGWSALEELPGDPDSAGAPSAALGRSGQALVVWTETDSAPGTMRLLAAARDFGAP